MDEGIITPVAPAVEIWKPPADLTEAEQVAADEARRAAMRAIKRAVA